MVKNNIKKTSAVGLIFVVSIGILAIVMFVPVSSEGTIFNMLNPSQPEPIACILIFAPVCGVNGETFDNACFAGVEGVEILHNGECSGDEAIVMTQDPSAFCRIYPTASGC